MIAAALLLAAAQPAPAAPCTERNAVRTTIARIGDALDGWIGRCVSLEGPMSSVALYSGVPGLYLQHRYRLDGNRDPVLLRRHRIGLYDPKGAIRSTRRSGPPGIPHIRVTGVIDSCDRMYARAKAEAGPNTVIMMGGYCHYHGGATIMAAQYEVHPTKRYVRLTGERMRAVYGDLVPMPEDWPHAGRVQEIADAFVQAGAVNDPTALIELHDLDTNNDHHARLLAALRPDRRWFVRAASEPAAVKLFISRLDFERRKAGRPVPDAGGTICIARGSPGSVAWPIAFNDASAGGDRPYTCTRTQDAGTRPGGVLLDAFVQDQGWLAEPGATAYRDAP